MRAPSKLVLLPLMLLSTTASAEIRIPGVRVMTQNMYVGLDVFPVLGAAPEDIPFVVADAFSDFVANRPDDRMAALASEIALVRPQLVGLQEVVELFEQFPSDAVLGQTAPNATDEAIDFLDVLLAELARRGARYEVAARQVGADIELPRFDGLIGDEPAFTDVRTRFSDVILRRAGVPTEPLFSINYAVGLPVPTQPGLVIPRNAVAVTAHVDGNDFRFVSTHLEPLVPGLPDDSQPQLGQVLELIERLATDHSPELPTLVVGDFNSAAPDGTSRQLMQGAGFSDVWTEREPLGQSGSTCCQDVVLDNPESLLSERIDYIFTQNLELRSPVLAFTIGDQPIFRTKSRPRLWPSDHAGVTALLFF
ncbi:MAG TPA: endonuclease/exonuclease/phosphatase family protein [Polyangiaceae bacterium]|nr:endonuclease/exonuclease/phosphatase family protein [Polyangiaceae bacterium]